MTRSRSAPPAARVAAATMVLATLGAFLPGCGHEPPTAPRRPTAAAAPTSAPAAVVEQAASKSSPLAGRPAPDFSLPDADGKTVSLAGLRGKWVVLYFYPQDDTPGCTCQANEFTTLLEEFREMNAEVFGVSTDTQEDHGYFREKYGLTLTLLSDPDAGVIRRYGARSETTVAGTVVARTVRQTFLIDPQGRIARHWPEVVPEGHAKRVREALAEQQRAGRR